MYKMEINVSGQRAKVWNRRDLAVHHEIGEGRQSTREAVILRLRTNRRLLLTNGEDFC